MKRVIVAGGGELGAALAKALLAVGNTVTVVESDSLVAAGLRAKGLDVIWGDAAVPAALERAGALRVDAVVACTGRDELNLVISLLARSHFEVPRVVARVNDPDNSWLFDASWGVDAGVSAVGSMIAEITEASGGAATMRLAEISGTDVTLVEVAIEEGSAGLGRPVSALALPPTCQVAALIRGGSSVPWEPGVVLAVGDRLVVVTAAGGSEALNSLFYPSR
jgi:trk system potassium uptake protein TrkA